MGKFSLPVVIQPLREETRETLEKSLLPLNRSEFICDLCGFENEVRDSKKTPKNQKKTKKQNS